MLERVTDSKRKSARFTTLRHPNSIDATIYEKRALRKDAFDPVSMQGGMPTIGGMTVLTDEDESDFDYVERGQAKVRIVSQWQPDVHVERDNEVLIQPNAQDAMIEAVAEPGSAEWFEADSRDLVVCTPGLGIGIAFEIVDVVSTLHIPPYTRRYVLNPRDDLHQIPGFNAP